jgi:polyphosphate glucokinase
MTVLAVDIGGTHVKILATGETEKRELASGTTLTPAAMVGQVKALATRWHFDRVAMGYPGPVLANRPVAEPHNLAPGWVGFDFAKAFGCPVKIVNDAAMQALGSYRGGKMLFLGFGTGLGTTLIADGIVEPMELGHLPYRKATYEDYVGLRGLERLGKKRWRERVEDVIARLAAALEPDDIVLGGGNAKLLKDLPPKCRLGDNANAFIGGFRLWERETPPPASAAARATRSVAPDEAPARRGATARRAQANGEKARAPRRRAARTTRGTDRDRRPSAKR